MLSCLSHLISTSCLVLLRRLRYIDTQQQRIALEVTGERDPLLRLSFTPDHHYEMFEKHSRYDGDVETAEHGVGVGHGYPSAEKTGIYVEETGAVPGESFAYGNTTYAKIQRFAGRYKIEQRGIERVPEHERTDKSLHIIGTMVRQ